MRHLILAATLCVLAALGMSSAEAASVSQPCYQWNTNGSCLQQQVAVVPNLTTTELSGSIAAANTFQTALAFNPYRLGAVVMNKSADQCLAFFGPAASATPIAAMLLPAGGSIPSTIAGPSTQGEIAISCPNAGDIYVTVENQ